jgi:hypothetical protein
MMLKKFVLLILFCVFVGLPQAFADEMSIRQDMTIKVADLFWQQKFVQLDEVERVFREEKTRTPSGVWMLTVYYRAFDSIISNSASGPEDWESVFRISEAWANASPKSPSAQMSKAIFLIKYASKIRNTNLAQQVPEDKWVSSYFKTLEKAGDELLKVKEIASQDPEWYIYMSDILIHYDRNEAYEKLIKEGLDRHPLYYQLYFKRAEYLFPKWHGDAAQLEDFANDAVKRTKDSEGMGMYARIYWVASQWNYGPKIFTNSNVVWPKMKQGMIDVLKKYPDQWNINNFAKFACLAKDKDMTRELIQSIKTPSPDVWSDPDLLRSCEAFGGIKKVDL